MQAQQWFAFPPLKACVLAKQLGCHPMDLLAHGGTVHADALLYPASTTWPMGFSWSSAIAQDTTLGILEASGLPRTQVLADSHPVPRDQSELAIVATDDVVLVHRCRRTAVARLEKLDAAMEEAGVGRSKNTRTSTVRMASLHSDAS